MSRSIKQPIYKDRGFKKESYWKTVRRNINNKVRSLRNMINPDDETIPDPKEIINDYDYSDYIVDARNYPDEIDTHKPWMDEYKKELKNKLKRK